MNRDDFWQKWLYSVSLGIITFGLFMALFNQTPLFNLFNRQIDPAFWSTSILPDSVISFQGWLYGVWGSTIAGWGIFLTFITSVSFKQREKWAWNCLVFGLSVWFLLDTGISIKFGVTFNILFNVIVALALALPLIFTRKSFVR